MDHLGAALLGLGLFETIRAVDGVLQAWPLHRRRLLSSHEALADGAWLPALAERPLEAEVLARLRSLGCAEGEARVRLTLIGPGAPGGRGRLHVDARPLDAAVATRRLGIHAWSVPWRPPITAAWKTTSYLPYLLAGRLARSRAACASPDHDTLPEALLVDEVSDHALEGATWNVSALVGDRLLTPPADGRLLPGVSRALLLEAAASMGLRTVESPLTVADLRSAEAALATNALLPVAPLLSLDGQPLPPPGPRVEVLREAVCRLASP